MPKVFSRLNICFVYLDDILVYNTSWKEHLQDLEISFNHLKEANLTIKLSKCHFCKQHLYYLGHLIFKQDIKEPNSMDELCHFLGLAGCYRRFIPLFANITKPLNKLLRKDTKFQ